MERWPVILSHLGLVGMPTSALWRPPLPFVHIGSAFTANWSR